MVYRRFVVRFAGALVMSAPVVLAGCGGGGGDGGGGSGGDATVAVVDVLFRPDEVTIDVGDTVTWEWGGQRAHQVVGTFAGTEVKSEQLTGSGSFSFTFASAGVFDYTCAVHGGTMSGKVTIE